MSLFPKYHYELEEIFEILNIPAEKIASLVSGKITKFAVEPRLLEIKTKGDVTPWHGSATKYTGTIGYLDQVTVKAKIFRDRDIGNFSVKLRIKVKDERPINIQYNGQYNSIDFHDTEEGAAPVYKKIDEPEPVTVVPMDMLGEELVENDFILIPITISYSGGSFSFNIIGQIKSFIKSGVNAYVELLWVPEDNQEKYPINTIRRFKISKGFKLNDANDRLLMLKLTA